MMVSVQTFAACGREVPRACLYHILRISILIGFDIRGPQRTITGEEYPYIVDR